MRKYIEKVASGLRAMKNKPHALLCCFSGDQTYDEPTICGITVFHSALVQNTMTDSDIPFIPIWHDDGDYINDRKRFNDNFEI